MLKMIDLMKDIHENAKAHGWWDTIRQEAGVRAMIVSEWAEALEEDRAGRSLVWHACRDAGRKEKMVICEREPSCPCKHDAFEQDCAAYDAKPEGVAVELIDGCIRILDYLGWLGYDVDLIPEKVDHATISGRILIENERIFDHERGTAGVFYEAEDMPVDILVDLLNAKTMESRGGYGRQAYVQAMCIALAWVDAHGVNPEALMLKKHRYNQTRTYKHGKKY